MKKIFNLLLRRLGYRTVRVCNQTAILFQALKNMLEQVELLISTSEPLPENRTPRCKELLRAALALTDDLLDGIMGRA